MKALIVRTMAPLLMAVVGAALAQGEEPDLTPLIGQRVCGTLEVIGVVPPSGESTWWDLVTVTSPDKLSGTYATMLPHEPPQLICCLLHSNEEKAQELKAEKVVTIIATIKKAALHRDLATVPEFWPSTKKPLMPMLVLELRSAKEEPQEDDLKWAILYAGLGQRWGGRPPAVTKQGSVGHLRGSFRLMQIISENSALVNRLDSRGLSIDGGDFRISGIETAERVDGKQYNISKIVVAYVGTYTYVTAGGSQRTVHDFKTVGRHQMLNALEFSIAVLEIKLEILQSSRVGQVVAAQRELKMYQPVAKKNETAAQRVAEASRRLEELGEVTDAEVQHYTNEKKKLQTPIQEMRHYLQVLRWLLGR